MYLENPKKLFNDLYNLPTMYCYMVACAEDGMDEDLQNLFSIVSCNRGEVHNGGEGSERWNLEYCETQEEVDQIYKDSRMIDAIYKQIQKEINAKYVIQCESCHHAWFTTRNTKCVKSLREEGRNSGWKCFCKGNLQVYTMEEWCLDEGINLKEITRFM
jgi:hypothetical protein